jgi:hypothetical protein
MKLLSILMLSSLVCFSAQAFEGKLVSLTLEDGTKISALKDVKEILTGPQNQIDQIELVSGEIFYDTEIRNATLLFNNKRSISLPASKILLLDKTMMSMRVGGDGSGGG